MKRFFSFLGFLTAFAIGAGGMLIALAWDEDLGPTPKAAVERLLLRNAKIVDVKSGAIVDRDLLLEDGHIAQLLRPKESTRLSDVRLVDLGGRYVLPGLIDLHAHLLRAGYCGTDEGIAWQNVAQIPFNFDVALRHGKTTVLDLGGPLEASVSVRDRLLKLDALAPRLLVAGPILTGPGGYPFDWLDRDLARRLSLAFEVSTTEDARAMVQHLRRAGVDVVKVAAMDRAYNDRELPLMTPEVLGAVVDEAHRLKMKVFVHAHTSLGYRRALDAKADVIAHSSFEALPEDIIRRVATSSVTVVPTLYVFSAFEQVRAHPELVEELGKQLMPKVRDALIDFDRRMRASADELPPDFLPGIKTEQLQESVLHARTNLWRMSRAGARIAFGTDTSFCYALQGSAYRELLEMEAAGMTQLQVLRAATVNGARVLGLREAGSIREGAIADLIVVRENPLDDLAVLAHPDVVVRAGRIVGEEVGQASPSFFRTLATLVLLLQTIDW